MQRAVLLLMHQGRSFTREASEAAAKLGISLVALSSLPQRPEALEDSRRHLADCLVTETTVLTEADIEHVVEAFAERGYAVEAAIATFEGYRLLMASLNQTLGAADSSAAALTLCLNKYDLRQFLRQRGLSEVRSYRLAPGARPRLDPAARWFVKPVRGASSFAAFILEDPHDLDDLPQLRQQMRADHRMNAIFMNQYDFLVEEYVEGPELSFETIVLDDAVHLCVQEKARVERLPRTTLEAMSISPPVGVSREVLLRGAEFVSRCFAELKATGLTAGAFHVEAKYWVDRDRWEIIEINPRIGGSLINASVAALTGESVLGLWLESLVLPDSQWEAFHRRLTRVSQLESLKDGTATRATVFLSKYGEKGRTIDSIGFDPGPRRPDVLSLHVQEGTTLDASDRAICLMDALWEVDAANLAAEVELLDRYATEHFHVGYR
jgi:biotin carboxylase